ncbi:MAG TPA: condensation domain-containing protein, partial [Candidatus Saccharimonadales bacterium]|nr:condensation domain-containing protein [Candidatus Saccharimonadales bacterium]
VRTGTRRVTCIFTHHHLLLDGWSLPFVLETVFGAVEALAAGRPLHAPAPEVMGRYAEWLSERNDEADAAFFRARLAGFDTPSPAPGPAGGRPDPPERSGVLLAPAIPGLRSRAGALGLTPGSVVQAALAFVVAGSSDLRDVVIGTTSSGPPAEVAGIETAVGLFINTLPLRVGIDPRARCRDWMLGVSARAPSCASTSRRRWPPSSAARPSPPTRRCSRPSSSSRTIPWTWPPSGAGRASR